MEFTKYPWSPKNFLYILCSILKPLEGHGVHRQSMDSIYLFVKSVDFIQSPWSPHVNPRIPCIPGMDSTRIAWGTEKYMYEVRSTPTMGEGLFAKCNIKLRDLILTKQLLIALHAMKGWLKDAIFQTLHRAYCEIREVGKNNP